MATPGLWSCSASIPPSTAYLLRELCGLPAVELQNNSGLNDMPADHSKRDYRRDMLFASMLVALGLVITALSLNQIMAGDSSQLAQATPPLQSTPGAETKPSAPPDPATTGTRPSDVPPQPARPDADAQKAGAQPALPPAPAEKTAPPIPDRQSPTKER